VIFELEALAIAGGELRLTVVAREERDAPKKPVRKCSGVRVIETTGHEVASVIPLRAAGGGR
jgi:hypothetical protein